MSFYFYVAEKLLNSEGRELRRALFSLKQIFQVSTFASPHCYHVLHFEIFSPV
jgi:hypothetical protein